MLILLFVPVCHTSVKRLLPHSSQWLWNGWFLFASQAWGAARKVSKDDWLEWLRRLSVVLLKESSSPALRSCWSLAQTYIPLARYTTSDQLHFWLPFFSLYFFFFLFPLVHIFNAPSTSLYWWKHLPSLIYEDRVKNLHLFLGMLQFQDA